MKWSFKISLGPPTVVQMWRHHRTNDGYQPAAQVDCTTSGDPRLIREAYRHAMQGSKVMCGGRVRACLTVMPSALVGETVTEAQGLSL